MVGTCRIVSYGYRLKDEQHLLIGAELRNTIKDSIEPKISGVFTLEDFQDNLDKLFEGVATESYKDRVRDLRFPLIMGNKTGMT